MIKKIDIDHAFAWFGEGQLSVADPFAVGN